MKKRIISILLVVSMLLTMLPMTALAVTDEPAIISIVACNTGTNTGLGVGDSIIITFSGNTNKPAIVAETVYSQLKLSNGHSWGTALQNGDFVWNDDGDTLTVTFSDVTGSTIAVGDTITLDSSANIQAYGGSAASTDFGTINGSFSPTLTVAGVTYPLSEAGINAAIAAASDGYTIRFNSSGTITQNADIFINKSITLDLNGKTINFSGASNFKNVNIQASVTVKGPGTITVDSYMQIYSGSTLTVNEGAVIEGTGAWQPLINSGTISMTGGALKQTGSGYILQNRGAATATFDNTTIEGNLASSALIWSADSSTLTLNNCTTRNICSDTGSWATTGSIILITHTSTVTLNGGTVTGPAGSTAPAILVHNSTTFTNDGATITNGVVRKLGNLTVSVSSGINKVTLAPQTAEAGATYYYKKTVTDDTAGKPATNGSVAFVSEGWTAFSTSTDIPTTVPSAMYVQVVKVDNSNNRIYGWGQGSATPTVWDADLSALSLSGGLLSPGFSAATTAYTVSVPNATSSISVTPTTSDSSATVKVNTVPVASGNASGAIALSVGSNTITIEVTAANPAATKTYTLTVTRASAPTPTPDRDRDNTPSPSGTNTPAPAPAPAPAPVIVIINGVDQAAATAETKKVDGKTVTTIIVDDKKAEEKLKTQGDNSKLVVPIKGDSDIKAAQLNGQSVKNMEAKNSVLEIKTDNVTYTLPAAQINIGKVSDSIGRQIELKDIKVNIQVSSPPQDTVKIVEDTAKRNSYQVVVKPVEFNIVCTSGNKTVEVSRFNGYVERTVAIPAGIDPGKITTGVVLNSDGTFSHVPTTITVIEGKYYAKINSLTNSTYSVIWSTKTFTDVEKHWAKNDINTMASRLVMDGIDNDSFDPDANITRGELADAVVRGLGLLRSGATTDKFTDVKPGHKYMAAISIATEYRLIGGYADNTYRPDNTITREEAMTILARAMKLAGMDVSITDTEVKEILSVYGDASEVNKTAANGAALCTRYGVFAGNNNILAPKGNITKAETAAVIKRLLQKAKLI